MDHNPYPPAHADVVEVEVLDEGMLYPAGAVEVVEDGVPYTAGAEEEVDGL
jgi:hypothetical protein